MLVAFKNVLSLLIYFVPSFLPSFFPTFPPSPPPSRTSFLITTGSVGGGVSERGSNYFGGGPTHHKSNGLGVTSLTYKE